MRSERFVSLGQVAGLFQFEIRGREPRAIPFSATDIRYAVTYCAVVRHDAVYPYDAPAVTSSFIGFGNIFPHAERNVSARLLSLGILPDFPALVSIYGDVSLPFTVIMTGKNLTALSVRSCGGFQTVNTRCHMDSSFYLIFHFPVEVPCVYILHVLVARIIFSAFHVVVSAFFVPDDFPTFVL